MKRLLAAIALSALSVCALAVEHGYAVSFAVPARQSIINAEPIVYCPGDATGSVWFPVRQVDQETGAWIWRWRADGIPPVLAAQDWVIYADDHFGHVAALRFKPSEGGRKVLSFGSLKPPKVKSGGIWFPPPDGVDIVAIERVVVVRNGKPLEAPVEGQIDLGYVKDGDTFSSRSILLGGHHYLQSMTITIELAAADRA